MAKKQESVLDFSALPMPSPMMELLPFDGSRDLTRDEQRITDEWQKQTLVIKASTAKTIFGQTKIAEIHKHGADTFDTTVGYIIALKAEAHGKEHQAYVEEFALHQIQSLAKHMMGTIEVGATNIGYEINRSLYPTSEQRGFFARLLGGS